MFTCFIRHTSFNKYDKITVFIPIDTEGYVKDCYLDIYMTIGEVCKYWGILDSKRINYFRYKTFCVKQKNAKKFIERTLNDLEDNRLNVEHTLDSMGYSTIYMLDEVERYGN